MTEQKKRAPRTKLTMTAMVDAASALYLSTLQEIEQENYEACSVVLRQETQPNGTVVYGASLWKHHRDGEPEEVTSTEDDGSFEGAVAKILAEVERTAEARRNEILRTLDLEIDKYKGILRGARGKIKVKK